MIALIVVSALLFCLGVFGFCAVVVGGWADERHAEMMRSNVALRGARPYDWQSEAG